MFAGCDSKKGRNNNNSSSSNNNNKRNNKDPIYGGSVPSGLSLSLSQADSLNPQGEQDSIDTRRKLFIAFFLDFRGTEGPFRPSFGNRGDWSPNSPKTALTELAEVEIPRETPWTPQCLPHSGSRRWVGMKILEDATYP